MDRIAIISDIHGNIPALSAVLNDIDARHISKIYCLGDLVGKGPYPEQAVDIIREKCEVVVMGNWDELVTRDIEIEEFVWQKNRLGSDRLAFLKALPFSYDFFMSGKLVRLFHASESSVFKRIQPMSPLEDRISMFENTEMTDTYLNGITPDVVGYGDVHSAFVQSFEGKTLFNTGSVGNPLEIPQASYAILEGTFRSETTAAFSIQLVRVPYDIELAIKQAKEENMPMIEPYIYELRNARYRKYMNE